MPTPVKWRLPDAGLGQLGWDCTTGQFVVDSTAGLVGFILPLYILFTVTNNILSSAFTQVYVD